VQTALPDALQACLHSDECCSKAGALGERLAALDATWGACMDASSSEWMSPLLLGVCCLTAGCVDLSNICGIDIAQAAKLCRSTLLIMRSGGWLFRWTLAGLQSGDVTVRGAAQVVEAQSDALLACLQLAESSGILSGLAAECVPPDRLVSWLQGASSILSLLTRRPGGCSQLLPAVARIPNQLRVGLVAEGMLEQAFALLQPASQAGDELQVRLMAQYCDGDVGT
jgi:hypothetical protein